MNEPKHDYDPDYAVPPGETLLETIQHLGLTQKKLALRMGRPIKTINEIIKGVASITAETSLQLEKVTGIAASFWNNAESNYRERLARIKEQSELSKQIEWVKRFSYTKMADLGLLAAAKTKEERVNNLLHFFGVASPAQWETAYSDLEGAAREANNTGSEMGDLSAWLRAGEVLAQRSDCKQYSLSVFQENLREIRLLTRQSPVDVWSQVCKLCSDAGVALALVPELPKTRVYGFTRWLTPSKALIQLSLRYKTDDILWFTFFHEAAHIILHGKKEIFIEFRGVDSPKEEEANQWASNFLISPSDWQTFIDRIPLRPDLSHIRRFSEEIGVANSIVLGRLQHREKRVRPNQFNTLKHKLEIQWNGID